MGFIFLYIGLLLIYLSQKGRSFYQHSIKNAREVGGIIVAHIKSRPYSSTSKPLIKLHLDGSDKYLLSNIGSNPPSGNIGDLVSVYLDPRNPNKAVFKSNLILNICSILAAVGAVFSVLSSMFIWDSLQNGLQTLDYIMIAVTIVFILMAKEKLNKILDMRSPSGQRMIDRFSLYSGFLTENEADRLMSGENHDLRTY